MKPETERIMQLADAYADAFDRKWGKERCALEKAIESLVADRDTLAAGVRDLVGCSAVRLDGIHVIQAAIAVAVRLKAASEPAKPPAVPEFDLVEVHPDGRAWRYRPGLIHGDYTNTFPTRWHHSVARRDVIADGATRFSSMPAALAWWRETHPEPAEHAEPAKLSPLAKKLEAMRVMVASQRDSNGNGFTGSDDAIAAVAAVVEALAKEAKR